MCRFYLRARPRPWALAAAITRWVGPALGPDVGHAEGSANAAIYVRQDTDHTTVVSPRLTLRAPLQEDTHLDLAYAVDVWTSASVDIVASASQPVTEQRDEVNVAIDHVIGDLTLNAAYRYSTEPDYESHGGSVGVSLDLAGKAATLAMSVGGSADQVGRVGDAQFAEEVNTLVAGLSFTQVISANALLQVLYDLSIVRGYQASAYRFVALGGDGLCEGSAGLCLAERNPRERMRHAAALRGRVALGPEWSLGGGYRAYLDDWGIASHTGKADLAWGPTARSTVALSYRFYWQSAADHYKSAYLDADLGAKYFTGDKELSPLFSHRAALELDWGIELGDGSRVLALALAVAPTLYVYRDFRLLDQITAVEVTAVAGMELP